ncbi:hypothetical protein AVEN_121090-1, partial [Araneus ventricosus]
IEIILRNARIVVATTLQTTQAAQQTQRTRPQETSQAEKQGVTCPSLPRSKKDCTYDAVVVFQLGIRGTCPVSRESWELQNLFNVAHSDNLTENLQHWVKGGGLKAILCLWPHIDKIHHCYDVNDPSPT